jgi:hypothetical protein
MASHFKDPPYWRDRARELRALADNLKDDPAAKEMILKCAQDYDKLAEPAQEDLRDRQPLRRWPTGH